MEDEIFYLMHKNIIVASLKISDNGQAILIHKAEDNIKHFPIGGSLNNSKFADWWKNRYIPEKRDGLKKALENAGYESTSCALIKNLALSLTDCYWIRPRNSDLKWEDVNLFSNDFNDPIGEGQFNSKAKVKIKKNKYDVGSSSGELKKKWFIDIDGKRVLVKGNFGNSFQQSLNEVFISNIHQQLGTKYLLKYELIKMKDENGISIVACKCDNFCNENTEFVSALEIIDSKKLKGSTNPFNLFREGCIELGIKEVDFDNYMDYLIMTDFLFTNTDRHLKNLGILRNPDNLKVIGFSPIFDNGNSMFYNIPFDKLDTINLKEIKVNSFFDNERKMLSYVRNKKILNLEKIKPNFSIYKNDIAENQIRYKKIEENFNRKLEILKSFQRKQ